MGAPHTADTTDDEGITPAVLDFVSSGTYPSSESIASATLGPPHLRALLTALQSEQDAARDTLRGISRTAAPDVDGWIARARALQEDIVRSRDTARDIVSAAEGARELEEKVRDAKGKVELLEKEVRFNTELEGRLEGVRRVNESVNLGKQAVVAGDVTLAVKGLQEADEGLRELGMEGSGVGALLTRKVEGLRESVVEAVEKMWDGVFVADVEEREVEVKGGQEEMRVVVDAARKLGLLEAKIARFAKEVERCLLRPRMTITRDERVHGVRVGGRKIRCTEEKEEVSLEKLFADLHAFVDFLAGHILKEIQEELSKHLVPQMLLRLEEDWLQPALPLEIEEMPEFQHTLSQVTTLAGRLDELEWHGSKTLHDWEKNAPRAWLTKRRETVLGAVRNLVFTGLRETKLVERVETQVVKKDQTLDEADADADDWGDAWDEPAEDAPAAPVKAAPVDDDDGDAWDMDDTTTEDKAGDDDGEAWGWDEGDEKAPESPKATKKQPATKSEPSKTGANAGQEVTYRETYMITGIPQGILALLQSVVQDAQTLAGDEYSSSPIAPAATALYTLPTLALAIYRAAAATAYAKLDSGHMLIYNDASRLSEELRAWQASQPASSRLRLDNDVKTLDQFAKRAYSSAMEAQRTILRDLLDGAQGFSNCSTAPFKAACESSVADAVFHLRNVHKQWQPILSSSALLQSIGSLLATLTGKIIADVEDLPDISEPDSKQIRILCDTTSEVKDLFTQNDPSGEERDMTFIYCPTWMKFQYLGEIMESSLADIKYLWNEGELSLEYDAEEVVGLIEALFAESALRRAAIAEVRRGGRR